MSDPHSPLRLNVGFVVAQSAGFSRDIPFDLPQINIPPDLHLSGLIGIARVTRTPQGILLQVDCKALINLECVRCLTDFLQTLNINFTELYAFSQRYVTDSGLLMPETGIIDIAPVLREYILLEIPISPLCRPDCNGLCPICGNNLNESTCNHEDDSGDPRLASLKSLLAKEA
ncbi:MAG: hypothetical protein A2Z71_10315 [Chloroflexi bacterium RBG_13_50_21]|nr:MAG: hypothetical protein A2Z71_10315 [Chloroflexi bacterium RBG_13_50_21]